MDRAFWKYVLMKRVPPTVSFRLPYLSLGQLVHLLKFDMFPFFFFFFSSRYVSAQKRPVRRNSCMETSRSCWRYRFEACTCVGLGDWRFVRGGSYQWDIRTRRPEGWMALGWQTGYPAAHLEVRGSHLARISQKDFRSRLVGHLGMK